MGLSLDGQLQADDRKFMYSKTHRSTGTFVFLANSRAKVKKTKEPVANVLSNQI